MDTFSLNRGTEEEKDDKRLDWMYKTPNESINRDDYLLGKPIDRQFEQVNQAEKDAELNRQPKNHIEHECIPPSLRYFSGDEQVDLARKLMEDPLHLIKKKEMESRAQLLKNPVKLKQLKQLLEENNKKLKTSEKHKKKKKKKSNSSEDGDLNLDLFLAAKFKKLKGEINEKKLLKSLKKSKKQKKKKRHSSSESESDTSDSESDSDDSSDDGKNNKSQKKKHKYKEKLEVRNINHQEKTSSIDIYSNKSNHSYPNKDDEKNRKRKHSRVEKHRSHSRDRNFKRRSRSPKKSVPHKSSVQHHNPIYGGQNSEKESSNFSSKRPKLSEEEKERRRQEMIANASWHDKEREKHIKKVTDAEQKELKETKYDKAFLQKHLARAADIGTVESRIKSNINYLQRSKHAMDSNFARR